MNIANVRSFDGLAVKEIWTNQFQYYHFHPFICTPSLTATWSLPSNHLQLSTENLGLKLDSGPKLKPEGITTTTSTPAFSLFCSHGGRYAKDPTMVEWCELVTPYSILYLDRADLAYTSMRGSRLLTVMIKHSPWTYI
ncbi:hypothetical protein J7T55_002153 [Diaporthe amygdali]|uniref:uncharacterized protein n=1 Tax=Phomopsis amygdali TaxID=1214568 RepID=UPI0022FEFE5D|nr:uncharacterized protein J7T55_002153 [Diaporthe amygdali]KAJ0108549.1 hypothetical protein J7T55_002153 [Diaporthe amygdali]